LKYAPLLLVNRFYFYSVTIYGVSGICGLDEWLTQIRLFYASMDQYNNSIHAISRSPVALGLIGSQANQEKCGRSCIQVLVGVEVRQSAIPSND